VISEVQIHDQHRVDPVAGLSDGGAVTGCVLRVLLEPCLREVAAGSPEAFGKRCFSVSGMDVSTVVLITSAGVRSGRSAGAST
jgi:hypothetical protein